MKAAGAAPAAAIVESVGHGVCGDIAGGPTIGMPGVVGAGVGVVPAVVGMVVGIAVGIPLGVVPVGIAVGIPFGLPFTPVGVPGVGVPGVGVVPPVPVGFMTVGPGPRLPGSLEHPAATSAGRATANAAATTVCDKTRTALRLAFIGDPQGVG